MGLGPTMILVWLFDSISPQLCWFLYARKNFEKIATLLKTVFIFKLNLDNLILLHSDTLVTFSVIIFSLITSNRFSYYSWFYKDGIYLFIYLFNNGHTSRAMCEIYSKLKKHAKTTTLTSFWCIYVFRTDFTHCTAQKLKFFLRISSVNVTKSAENWGFTEEILIGKLHFLRRVALVFPLFTLNE